MSSNPIDFRVNFGGIAEAAAAWKGYQSALGGVIQASAQLGTSQATTAREIQQTQQALAATSQSFNAYSQAVVNAANSQAQFATNSQQTVSIFSGAGTAANSASAQMAQFSGSMANLGKFVGPTNKGLDQSNILMENLAGTSQTTGQKIQALGQGFGQAAGSITGLIFSAHSLNRAQFTLHQTETRLEAARNKLADQTKNLGKVTQQYGADSEQVAAILADIGIQTERVTNFEERAGLVQESYNMTLLSFATTTGPLVISTVSSVSQGITSMGDVLNISRKSAISFISAWGPWIAAGGAVVAIGLSVIDTLNKVAEAEKQRSAAMQTGDAFGQLNAELKILQDFDTNPLFKIGEALRKGILPQGAAESKEFHLELDLRQWQSDLTNQIDSFITDPEFKAAFESLPPAIQKTLTGELDSVVGIPFNPVNFLNPDTGEVDPAFMAKSKELLDKALTDLAKHVAEKQAEFKRITLSGTADERAGIMGLPTAAEFKEATALYKGNMQSVLVLLKDFNTKRLADARLTWDQYIAQTDVPQWFADLAKNVGNVDASFQGTGIQGSKEWFASLRGGFQEVTDAENAMLPKSQEVVAQLGLLKGVMDDAGVSADGTASKYDNYVKAVEDATKGHEDQIAQEKAVNMALRDQVATWAGPLPASMKFTDDTLQKANDTFKETGSVTEGVNVLLAQQRAEFDQLRQSLGDVDQQIQGVIDSTDTLTTAQEKANSGLATWFDGITKSIAQEDAERVSLIAMAKSFGIDLPAGIKLTNDQLKALVEAYRRTGTEAGAMAAIHAQVFGDMHKRISEVVDAFTEGGKEMSKAWKDIKDSIPKGQQNFMKDLFGDTADMRENSQALADTAAAMDFLLDTTRGQLKDNQIEDWSKKFSKGLGDLRDSAEDLPFVDKELLALIDSADKLAKSANDAQDFRVLDEFITELNKAIASGDPNAIAELEKKWGSLFDAFAKGQNIDFNAINNGLDGVTASTQTLLDLFGKMPKPEEIDQFTNAIGDILGLKGDNGDETTITPVEIPAPVKAADFDQKMADTKAELLSLSGTSDASGGTGEGGTKTAGITLTPVVIPTPDNSAANVALQTTQTAFANLSTQGSNSMAILIKNIKPHIETLNTYFGTTVVNAIKAAETELLAFSLLSSKINTGGGGNGNGLTNVALTEEQQKYNENVDKNPPKDVKPTKGGVTFEPFNSEDTSATDNADYQNWLTQKTEMETPIVVPAPNVEAFIQGINTASEVAFGFISTFTSAMAESLVIGAPNLEAYIAQMDVASSIALLFISGFNNLMGGGGEGGAGGKKKNSKGGLMIGAPNLDQFVVGMNTASEIALLFISGFNNLMGGGAGGKGSKGKKSKGGLMISAPNIDNFIAGMDLASQVALGFIETFNSAMGGGGGKDKKKKKGGLIIPSPAMDEYIAGIDEASTMAADFIDLFTTGMQDMADGASNAAGDITSSFDEIGSSADDAAQKVQDLQSDIDNLHGKTVTVTVNATGDGLKFLASGYHGVINKPTILVVGEAGPERVDVSPSNQAPTGLSSDRNVNINPVFTQSASNLKDRLGSGISDLIDSIPQGKGGGINRRELERRIRRLIQIPIKIELNKKTLLDVLREEFLDD